MKIVTAYILILSLVVISCATKKDRDFSADKNEKEVRIANDSLEYELIVFDVGFNQFLNGQARPKGYYGLNFLEIKNNFYVTQYNIKASNPIQFGDIYGPRIEYNSMTRYGYEVNYLLYNYFLFFQQKYRVKL